MRLISINEAIEDIKSGKLWKDFKKDFKTIIHLEMFKDFYEWLKGDKAAIKDQVNAVMFWEVVYGITAALALVYAVYNFGFEEYLFADPMTSMIIQITLMLIAATMSQKIYKKIVL